MATNERFGVGFAIDAELQPVRLIELPPALLKEITEKDASLQLKSTGGVAEGAALICTSSQTFTVRQNQSSNTLLLTETATEEQQDGVPSETIIRAVAQPKGMLEILPTKTDAVSYLQSELPVLSKDLVDPYSKKLSSETERTRVTIDACEQKAPFSRGEFQDALKAVCGFEHEGYIWRPAPEMALEAWKAVIGEASAKLDDYEKPEFSLTDIWAGLTDYGLPDNLFAAIVSRNGTLQDEKATLEPKEAVLWTGEMTAQCLNAGGIGRDSFISRWQEHIPSSWWSKATIESLVVKKVISESGNIVGRPSDVSNSSTAGNGARKVNNWHEKLRASRR